jgi:hypothetical protein
LLRYLKPDVAVPGRWSFADLRLRYFAFQPPTFSNTLAFSYAPDIIRVLSKLLNYKSYCLSGSRWPRDGTNVIFLDLAGASNSLVLGASIESKRI